MASLFCYKYVLLLIVGIVLFLQSSVVSFRRVLLLQSGRKTNLLLPPLFSEEESLKLDVAIQACSFLHNINEYGKARMARRAVGVLQKMPAYKVIPSADHFNAAIRGKL